jgi:hypothetical protein
MHESAEPISPARYSPIDDTCSFACHSSNRQKSTGHQHSVAQKSICATLCDPGHIKQEARMNPPSQCSQAARCTLTRVLTLQHCCVPPLLYSPPANTRRCLPLMHTCILIHRLCICLTTHLLEHWCCV